MREYSDKLIPTPDQKMEKQFEELRGISGRYEHDKKVWVATVKEVGIETIPLPALSSSTPLC